MENKTKSRENKSYNILQVPICNKGRTCFIFVWRPPFVLSFLGITFDNRMTFTKHFEEILECCNQKFHRGNFRMLQPKISSFKNIGQQKVGPKSRNHFTNLQTMCGTNIQIWDCFCHNCFGNCHHKNTNTKSPELFHQASTSPPKVRVSSLIT